MRFARFLPACPLSSSTSRASFNDRGRAPALIRLLTTGGSSGQPDSISSATWFGIAGSDPHMAGAATRLTLPSVAGNIPQT